LQKQNVWPLLGSEYFALLNLHFQPTQKGVDKLRALSSYQQLECRQNSSTSKEVKGWLAVLERTEKLPVFDS